MNDRALESMRLQTIADYWIRADLKDYNLTRKCARDQADEEGLRFTQKDVNSAVRRAFNRLSDTERDELYPTIDRPDMQPRLEDLHELPSQNSSLCHQDEDQGEDQDQDERGGLRETSAVRRVGAICFDSRAVERRAAGDVRPPGAARARASHPSAGQGRRPARQCGRLDACGGRRHCAPDRP